MDSQGLQTAQPGDVIQDPLFSLEELTVNSTQSIAQIKDQIKEARLMIKAAYAGSELFNEQKGRVDSEKLQLSSIKKEIDAKPENAALLQKVKDLLLDLKEKELTVSDCALEYTRMAGKDEIEKNGITYDIVKTAKLVKRKQ